MQQTATNDDGIAAWREWAAESNQIGLPVDKYGGESAPNFNTALMVLKARLAELNSHAGGIPYLGRREAELRNELERVRGEVIAMLRERGNILRAIEELGGEVDELGGEV